MKLRYCELLLKCHFYLPVITYPKTFSPVQCGELLSSKPQPQHTE